ncbi:MAG: amidohydrolase family protein, partial [Acidimicrobiia bacterium]
LEENARFLREGGRGMVGIHAAFTCSDETLEGATAIATEFGVGVHIHVCEGPEDIEAPVRLGHLTQPNWLLAHCVHLATNHQLRGTILHNPASNLNNAVGYADPRRFVNPVALGTDGIGADMLSEFRLAYYLHRSVEVTAGPETAWSWLEAGSNLAPEARTDRVTWSYDPMDAWHLAFTSAVRPLQIEIGGEVVWKDGTPTRVDPVEIVAKASEQAKRLHARL